jgi:hypothetical protein
MLLIYSTATWGVTVHLHYCMDELVGSSLWHNDDDKCGKCGMTEKKGGCCKDEHKSFQIKTEHQKGDAAKSIQSATCPAIVSGNHGYVAQFAYKCTAIVYPVSHAPPPNGFPPLFIQHCSFLI